MPEKALPRSLPRSRSTDGASVFAIRPLTPAEWHAFEDLFGPERGASSCCWCMWTRMPRPQWKAMPREERKAAFRTIVESGPAPGLLAFDGDKAAAWCAIAPRSDTAKYDGAKVSQLPDSLRGELHSVLDHLLLHPRRLSKSRTDGPARGGRRRPCAVTRRVERGRVRYRNGTQADVGRRFRRDRLGLPQARLPGDRPPYAHSSAHAAFVLIGINIPATIRASRAPARGRRDP